jgi:lipoate-protein ligase A
MKFLELSFAEAAANLACDEALLERLEMDPSAPECLRIWEAENHFVVLGHSNSIAAHVNREACAAAQIPLLRRLSGGGTVVQGPGCVNYALLLRNEQRRSIVELYRYVLEQHRRVFQEICHRPTCLQGLSDLTIDGFKFSGNAQYRKAKSALVHGTFLLHFDLAVIERLLPLPPAQPEYRRNRPHNTFVANLGLKKNPVVEALRRAWRADKELSAIPVTRIEELARARYRDPKWTEKF